MGISSDASSDSAAAVLAAATEAQRLWNASRPIAEQGSRQSPTVTLMTMAYGSSAQRLRVYRGDMVIDDQPVDDSLLLPLKNAGGEVVNVCFLGHGWSHLLPGGQVEGTYAGWGSDRRQIIVCRSFAHAARVHADTGSAVAVAWGAPDAVVDLLRRKYSGASVMRLEEFELDTSTSKLLGWLQRKALTEITPKQTMQYGPSCVRRAEKARAALRALVALGHLTEQGGVYRVTGAQSLQSEVSPPSGGDGHAALPSDESLEAMP